MLRVGDLVSIKFEKIKGEIVEFKNNRILIFDYCYLTKAPML